MLVERDAGGARLPIMASWQRAPAQSFEGNAGVLGYKASEGDGMLSYLAVAVSSRRPALQHFA